MFFFWVFSLLLVVTVTVFNSAVFHFWRPCGWWHVPLASNNYGSCRQSICWGCVPCIHSLPTRLPIQATQGKNNSRVSISLFNSSCVSLSASPLHITWLFSLLEIFEFCICCPLSMKSFFGFSIYLIEGFLSSYYYYYYYYYYFGFGCGGGGWVLLNVGHKTSGTNLAGWGWVCLTIVCLIVNTGYWLSST